MKIKPNRLALNLGLGVFLIYLAFLPPGVFSIDGRSMIAVAQSLVTKLDVTVPPDMGIVGRDGQYYSKWYPLLSIIALPFVALGLALGHFFSLPVYYMAAACALPLSAGLTAGCTSFVALLALRLGSTKRGAIRAALAFTFGTIALAYARTFFAEPLLALIMAASVYFVLRATRQDLVFASVLAGLAVLAKPTGMIVGPILSGYLLLKKRSFRVALAPAIGTGMGTMLYMVYNYARFGQPLSFGQSWTFSLSAFPEGFVGLLFSPGRGLLWYCPPVILSIIGLRDAIRARLLNEALMIGALSGSALLLHSFYSGWAGGWSWGPRYLMPTLPILLCLTSLLEEQRWKKMLIILTVAGFIVNAPTLVSFYDRYYAEANEQEITSQLVIWSPQHAPLIHVWRTAYRQVDDARKNDVKEMMGGVGRQDPTIATGEMLRVVALWWWMLPLVGIPRWVGVVVSLILLALAARLIANAQESSEETHDQSG